VPMLDISELASRVRMQPSALRYYERIGLLPRAERANGRRIYPASTIRRIALIKMAQRAGFTLAEIRDLLAGGGSSPGTTRQWRSLAESKLPELDQLIDQIQTLRQAVADCLTCGCMNFATCRLLAPLDAPAEDAQ
jgi:MerR family transcriptional regulator, redox-sensitive transcriptional activator SoxR